MPSCLTCGKLFHACSSCGLTNQYEYEYCSVACWEGSEAYKVAVEDIETAMKELGLRSFKELHDYIEGINEEVLWHLVCKEDQ